MARLLGLAEEQLELAWERAGAASCVMPELLAWLGAEQMLPHLGPHLLVFMHPRTILLSVISLLNEPNTFSPANVDASVMYRKWKESKGKDREYTDIIRCVLERPSAASQPAFGVQLAWVVLPAGALTPVWLWS